MVTYAWSYVTANRMRTKCTGACKTTFEKGSLRLGITESAVTRYRCIACVTAKQVAEMVEAAGSLDKVDGFESLPPEAQAKVREKEGVKPAAKRGAKAAPKGRVAAASKPPPLPLQHTFLDKAKEYDFEGVKEMLEETPELVNVQPSGRWSALHQFANNGHEEAVKYLLEKGADRNAKLPNGQTPRDVADESVASLLDEPAAPEEEEAEAAAEEEEEAPAAAAASSSSSAAKAKAAAPKRKAPEVPVGSPAKKAKAAPVAPAPSPKKAKGGGAIPVDKGVPGRDDYTVVGDWSVLLNQTNVAANNNKYYKIQVLKSADDSYYCWQHWGRVGSSGQHKLEPCGTEAQAQNVFRKKFREKSGVPYEQLKIHDWTPVMGKYTYVETDEQDGDGGGGGDGAPLGKLTPQQIEKGQDVLHRIEEALVAKDPHTLNTLSSEFYTLIPHDFGFKIPPAITTKEMLEAEEELLKFYMRMGFEEMEQADGLTPVSGIMELELPPSLEAASSMVCSAKDIKASAARGKMHAEKQSGKPEKPMEAHLYGAIMLYTSNAIYKNLNAVLRSEDRTKIKKYFSYLRLLLEALDRLPKQKRTLWRGVGVDLYDQYTTGSTITWWGVSSCTSDQNVAKSFMKGCGGKCTLLTVETKTAADISEITFFGNEKESLLAPGTQLKVLSSKREGNVTEIRMQEVGRVLS